MTLIHQLLPAPASAVLSMLLLALVQFPANATFCTAQQFMTSTSYCVARCSFPQAPAPAMAAFSRRHARHEI